MARTTDKDSATTATTRLAVGAGGSRQTGDERVDSNRCLGSHVARMELRAALGTWHERVPDYSIAPGQEPVYSHDGVRMVDPLPLVIRPRRSSP